MQYVILISGQPLASACISLAAEATRASLLSGEDGIYHFDMHDDAVRVRIENIGSSLSDWQDEPEKLARLKKLGPSKQVYAVHYKNVSRLKSVVVALANCAEFVIDDDYGIFLNGSDFVELSEAHPNDNRWWLGGHYP